MANNNKTELSHILPHTLWARSFWTFSPFLDHMWKFCYFVAKVSINIENYKLYARKSNSFIDKWIVIRKMRLKKVRQRLTFFVMVPPLHTIHEPKILLLYDYKV